MAPRQSLTDEFPPESWILDFRTVMEMKDQDRAPTALRERIYQRRPDAAFANEYEKRFAAAYMYLRNNMNSFDVPSCALVSSSGSALLTDYLFYALYLLFISVPIESIRNPFPVDAVIRSAQKAESQNRNN